MLDEPTQVFVIGGCRSYARMGRRIRCIGPDKLKRAFIPPGVLLRMTFGFEALGELWEAVRRLGRRMGRKNRTVPINLYTIPFQIK